MSTNHRAFSRSIALFAEIRAIMDFGGSALDQHFKVVAKQLSEANAKNADLLDKMAVMQEDATRYQRLRIIGVAPNETRQLVNSTVIRFQVLDAYCDAEIKAYPSRGEALGLTAAEVSAHRAECDRLAKVAVLGAAAVDVEGWGHEAIANDLRKRASDLEEPTVWSNNDTDAEDPYLQTK